MYVWVRSPDTRILISGAVRACARNPEILDEMDATHLVAEAKCDRVRVKRSDFIARRGRS